MMLFYKLVAEIRAVTSLEKQINCACQCKSHVFFFFTSKRLSGGKRDLLRPGHVGATVAESGTTGRQVGATGTETRTEKKQSEEIKAQKRQLESEVSSRLAPRQGEVISHYLFCRRLGHPLNTSMKQMIPAAKIVKVKKESTNK
jgi:hypothetical protein